MLIPGLYSANAQVFASGDVNDDDMVNATDLTILQIFIVAGGPAPDLIHEGDLNGDGYLDEADIDLLVCYLFFDGEDCFDEYPVPTIEEVDTARGCCCEGDEVHTRSGANCTDAGGDYMGDGNLCYLPGNADNSYLLNIFDVTYIIAFKYQGGPAPQPYELMSGDFNGDCVVNIFDVTGLIGYLYKDGPPPCNTCEWVNHCGLPIR